MQHRKQSPIKDHGKFLSLLHKDYCQLQTDYSQGGQKSPEAEINTQWVQLFQTLENRVEDNLSLISFGTLHEWVRAVLQF